MTPFSLKIVTPDGMKYDGQVEELIVRTTSGDLGILAGHTNCVAPLGMGQAMILANGKRRYAACIGGMVSVVNGNAKLLPTTFDWAEDIDVDRVLVSENKARTILGNKASTDTDIRMAEARLKRALIRKSVASYK